MWPGAKLFFELINLTARDEAHKSMVHGVQKLMVLISISEKTVK